MSDEKEKKIIKRGPAKKVQLRAGFKFNTQDYDPDSKQGTVKRGEIFTIPEELYNNSPKSRNLKKLTQLIK
jgi:hypothetical protein